VNNYPADIRTTARFFTRKAFDERVRKLIAKYTAVGMNMTEKELCTKKRTTLVRKSKYYNGDRHGYEKVLTWLKKLTRRLWSSGHFCRCSGANDDDHTCRRIFLLRRFFEGIRKEKFVQLLEAASQDHANDIYRETKIRIGVKMMEGLFQVDPLLEKSYHR
jgi:hypothetical protein